MEGDDLQSALILSQRYFNPLPPHGGRPVISSFKFSVFWDFNPLPPHGGRPDKKKLDGMDLTFQSTPSAWRETLHRAVQTRT